MNMNLNELYFIRLTDNKNGFVHVEVPFIENPNYIIKEGIKGAVMFDETNAKLFIEISDVKNIEMVKASEQLTN